MPTALITGASSGFGKATAEVLAKNNFRLILVARRQDRLDELKQNLQTDVFTACLDVRDKTAVANFFSALPKEWQTIDALVNCAGLASGLDPATEANLDDWDLMIDTNVKGLVCVTRHVLDFMKVQNSGIIINLGSVAANVPYKGGNVYGATKAFVRQFSRNLRADLLGTQIKVTNIEPGAAETEFSLVRFKNDKMKADAVYNGMRPLVAQDIAHSILWVIQQPPHVNIDNIEIMPLDQSFAGLSTHRT